MILKGALLLVVIELTAILPIEQPNCLEINANCSRVPHIGAPGFPPFPPYVSDHHIMTFKRVGRTFPPIFLMSETEDDSLPAFVGT